MYVFVQLLCYMLALLLASMSLTACAFHLPQLHIGTRLRLCGRNEITTPRINGQPTRHSPNAPWNITILSDDPKVFCIDNFLGPDECRSYIQWAKLRAKGDGGDMTRSNPPSVSLDLARLWPLPLLCLLAGVPSSLRFIEQHPPINDLIWGSNLLQVMLPAISLAAIITSVLCLLSLILVRIISEKSSRTSEAISLNSVEDCEFIRPLVERASRVTNHSWDKWEAPVVSRYQTGARFASHNDASPNKGLEWSDVGGQRVVTVITYLNTCPNGGGTKFDKLGFTVQPKEGSALVFFPADSQTLIADQRTVHQSLPAVEEKWIVQLFGRIERVPVPLGSPIRFNHPMTIMFSKTEFVTKEIE